VADRERLERACWAGIAVVGIAAGGTAAEGIAEVGVAVAGIVAVGVSVVGTDWRIVLETMGIASLVLTVLRLILRALA